MKIQLLPSEVIDQIAAGEVVERPSHMIKELVENSLDAGATEIEVEMADGGRWVKVTDNGSGIEAKDLPAALERHSTSKINKASDLWDLHSFGFRGEALASIAAVSKLTLISRTAQSSASFRIQSHFGVRSEVMESGGSPGTTIVIEDLFANVPVRLKFLKSEAAEETQIKTTLKALALVNPQTTFRVKSRGQLIHLWPKVSSLMERAQAVLEQKELYEAVREIKGFQIHFCYSPPHLTAKSSRQMWLFAQKRWVQDRTLQAAILEAYRNLLMHGEYPIVVCSLLTPPDEIDVNIHPTKSQVKMRDQQGAFRAVHSSLREALERAPWVEATTGVRAAEKAVSYERPQEQSLRFSHQDFEVTQFPKKEMGIFETLKNYAPARTDLTSMPPSQESNLQKKWSLLEVIGQANQTYIVTQTHDSLILIDQHAAHERIVFERIMNAWRGGKIEKQDYLIPLTLDMNADQVEALIGQAQELERIGIEVEQLGPESIGVKSAPAILSEKALAQALEKLSDDFVHKGGSYALERVIGDVAATLACHSVVRAGQSLSVEQMRSLLEQMDEYPLSSFCPHGRPVFVEYPFPKIERDFGRIV